MMIRSSRNAHDIISLGRADNLIRLNYYMHSVIFGAATIMMLHR